MADCPDDGNPCTDHACNSTSGECETTVVPDGTLLDNACTTGRVCLGGELDETNAQTTELNETCAQENDRLDPYGCVAAVVCDPHTNNGQGSCVPVHVEDGAQCWIDEEGCTNDAERCHGWICQGGSCVRDASGEHDYVCGESEEDYPPSCQGDEGCKLCTSLTCHWQPSNEVASRQEPFCYAEAVTGVECDDGDACTINDVCRFGREEDAAGFCGKATTGRCVGTDRGEVAEYACRRYGWTTSEDGECRFSAEKADEYCERLQPCMLSPTCIAIAGTANMAPDGCAGNPKPEGTPCEYEECGITGLVCSLDESTGAMLCTGEAVDCDDGNPCTQDSFECGTDEDGEEFASCAHRPLSGASCDDGDGCLGDMCVDGLCASVCEDGDPCTENACVDAQCQDAVVMSDGSDCSDVNPCDGPEYCQNGACVAQYDGEDLRNHITGLCDDGNDCTRDYCDATVLSCVNDAGALNGVTCPNDDNPCTVGTCASGVCSGPLTFQPGPCDDRCDETNNDTCNRDTMTCQGACPNPDDQCLVAVHLGYPGCCGTVPKACDDGNLCTEDTCDPNTGCRNVLACDDGSDCTEDRCEAPELGCVHEPSPTAECRPGEEDYRECGSSCGQQRGICNDSCRYDWGECTGQGDCAPGDVDGPYECGNCGHHTRTCSSSCAWSDWGVCADQGCEPGSTEDRNCGECGTQTRTCDQNCDWGSYGVCVEGGDGCRPGETQDCPGRCGAGTQTCNSQCEWSDCSEPSDPPCCPSETETRVCERCGTEERTCSSSYQWGSWGPCLGSRECEPEQIDRETCSGDAFRECNNSCYWGNCICEPHASQSCDGGQLYWFDSCGGREEQVLPSCPCGCEGSACMPNVFTVTPEYPSFSASTHGVYDCQGGVVMQISGLVDGAGNLTVRVGKEGGEPLGPGTYFVRVFDERVRYDARCDKGNVVRATETTTTDRTMIEFDAFDSYADCGTEKSYCVTKMDGGEEDFWCSGILRVNH